jgi:hypothetical protein
VLRAIASDGAADGGAGRDGRGAELGAAALLHLRTIFSAHELAAELLPSEKVLARP